MTWAIFDLASTFSLTSFLSALIEKFFFWAATDATIKIAIKYKCSFFMIF